MTKAKILVDRCCPYCRGLSFNELAQMTVGMLLKANPGYNNGWFTEETVSPDTECRFVRCKDCGFVYSASVLSDEMLARYYNEAINMEHSQAKIYKRAKREGLINLWQALHARAAAFEQIRLLDFGAGWGDFLAVARCVGVEAFGLDFDQRKVAFASNFGVRMGDLAFIREHGPYNAFMCNQVLEHVAEPRSFLQTLRVLLCDGAVGYLAVPLYDEAHLRVELDALASGKLPSKDFDPLGHLNYFTPENLRSMVFAEGFCEISAAAPLPQRRLRDRLLGRPVPEAVFSTALWLKAV